MQPSTRTIEFSPAEREAFEQRQRQWQATLERIAAAPTLEESQRIGEAWWRENIEQPRAARRIKAARQPRVIAVIMPRPRAREQRPAATRRTSSSSRTASQDPGSDPDPDDGPWALSLVDRAPFLWRFRALRCRFREWREGVVE
jgi:hypothetical protein